MFFRCMRSLPKGDLTRNSEPMAIIGESDFPRKREWSTDSGFDRIAPDWFFGGGNLALIGIAGFGSGEPVGTYFACIGRVAWLYQPYAGFRFCGARRTE